MQRESFDRRPRDEDESLQELQITRPDTGGCVYRTLGWRFERARADGTVGLGGNE